MMHLKAFLFFLVLNKVLSSASSDKEKWYIPTDNDPFIKDYLHLETSLRHAFLNITTTLNDHERRKDQTVSKYVTVKDMERIAKDIVANISELFKNNENELQDKPIARDCSDVHNLGNNKTGTYLIYPTSIFTGIRVRCDMETSGGGWTIIQRRIFKSDFYRTWDQYAAGFGNLETNFWLGKDNIHSSFSKGKKLPPLSKRGREKFSTFDKDNDIHSKSNCAQNYHGAWWYSACHTSNLNGDYGNMKTAMGPVWQPWKGYNSPMKKTEMKIRRV
ncbi:techylectin-5B-like [Ruditapes philippinarum]|uniref:techylectin-5B-like n=1 Tax=Ruditapes philippinarum TaxID=129788 RepID=UPI00295B2BE4|nr:techylectin-5B-like [Ruditapes philippinarum]